MTRQDRSERPDQTTKAAPDPDLLLPETDIATEIRWTPDAVRALMRDPTLSDWMKDAIAAMAKRDPEEALRDAETLHALMTHRWEKHMDTLREQRLIQHGTEAQKDSPQ